LLAYKNANCIINPFFGKRIICTITDSRKHIFSNDSLNKKAKKGKAIPVTGRGGP
jgi:hypothetical protein